MVIKMKAVIQRVKSANVKVDHNTVGEISKGLLIFLGVGKEDSEKEVSKLVDKVLKLRIFEDEAGKMNLSVMDVGGEVLIVSQFTLYGDCRKGRRPSFVEFAAPPEKAKTLYERFIEETEEFLQKKVQKGIFGADMQVSLVNDGPVTFILDTLEL